MATDALFTLEAETLGASAGRERAGARVGGAIAAAVAVLIGTGRWLTSPGGTPSGATPAIIAGTVAAVVAVAVTIKRLGGGRVGSTGRARLELSSEGVTLTSLVQSTTAQWMGVRIEERRNAFLFYLPEGQTVRVTKAAINEPQGVERLRSFLMGQVGTRAKLLS